MIDKEKVCGRLRALERYCTELEGLQRVLEEEDFKRDLKNQWMVEHGLQLAIECMLDIGNHLIAAESLGSPQSYREIIEVLGQKGVIPEAFAAAIKGMAGFRNILIHDYLAVDLDEAWKALHEGPGQFREFIRYIATYLNKQ